MKKRLIITDRIGLEKLEIEEIRRMSGKERLELVEKLRIQWGKIKGDYPARLQRVLRVVERKQS